MKRFFRPLLAVAVLLAVFGLSTSLTFSHESPPEAPAGKNAVGAALYTQNSPAASSRATGQYAGALVTFADDFVVPIGQTWNIGGIGVDIVGDTPDNWGVRIYADNAGLPGAVLCTEAVTSSTLLGGFRVLEYSTPCSLTAGTYWAEVLPNYSCAFGAGCVSTMSFTATITGSEMAFMNDSTCPAWIIYSTCTSQPSIDMRFAIYAAPLPLAGNTTCDGNGNAQVTITNGDPPFTINYTRDGVPQTAVNAPTLGTYTLTGDNLGPNAFTAISVTEGSGDAETVGLTNVTCIVPIDSTATCNANDLQITINGGDGPFNITGTGTGLPLNGVGVGTHTVTGPNAWQNVTVVETSGDTQADNNGNFNCGTTGVNIVETAIFTNEAGTTSTTFDVVLTSVPTADVTVTITGLDATEGSLDMTSLTFSAVTWNAPQTVTLTAVDDTIADGDITYTLTATTSSAGDANYNAGLTDTVTATNRDDETASLFVSPRQHFVAEDSPGENSFVVRLGSPPTGTVTITFAFDTSQLTLSPSTLTFDNTNWNVNQVVNVDAVADGITEDILTYPIVLTTSGSGIYNGLTETLSATIFDSADLLVIHVPNFGLVMIQTWQAQPVFQSPHEGVVRMQDTAEMWFPIDADGNGFDTYVVTDIRTYNDEAWLALWMGSSRWVWIPYDPSMLTVIQPLDWDIQTEWVP